ncbi:TetR/AcrR family transcriptional regulator [Saccharomonospora glauca]|uniref:Transcriptional regulator n=1 Tax=Saccharomonospora glauca K62 TaxID=928724 RepID=I1D872_9PSEU|nr:TetR/AcrR family transcriptional regulator [Saccharomonospora glauca]EIF01147.1 transcriptional regulator [Saccharomonospora glauca K62]
MARPRTVDRQRLLDAAAAVIAQEGPGFTLAKVAERAGVSVGSVAGHFGSKHGLLVALSTRATERVTDLLREAAEAASTPREAARAALVALYSGLGDATSAANHLAQLGVDLADPALRELLARHYAVVEDALRDVLRRATEDATHRRGPDPDHAARVLLAVANGAAIDWSIRPRGDLVTRLNRDIDAITRSWWE